MVQTLNSNLQQISFHDPEGHVFKINGRILRQVSLQAGYRLQKFLGTQLATDLIKDKLIPATRVLELEDLSAIGISTDQGAHLWFEHQKIQFVSYAYEWVPEMLLAAAELTLNLVKRLHADGWDLKDASAHNVVFDGTLPIFIDLTSIIERKSAPYWWPKGQFERHFILPLIAYVYRALPPDRIHFFKNDGLDPYSLSGLLGIQKWITKLGLKHCAIPLLLTTYISSKKLNRSTKSHDMNAQASDVALAWHFRSLAKSLRTIRTKLPAPESNWLNYTCAREHYKNDSLSEKLQIVVDWLKILRPATVLDLGANTGEFSLIAAVNGARVISFENDIDSARLAYANAQELKSDCQIFLQDLGNPSPPMGWRQVERKSIDQRLDGEIDCVFALAILHHWLVSSGIPLDEVLAQLSNWTQSYLIIEYIPPTDEMFLFLCEQRRIDFSWLNSTEFESKLEIYFNIINISQLKKSGRILYSCAVK